jgi:hypothetical protein
MERKQERRRKSTVMRGERAQKSQVRHQRSNVGREKRLRFLDHTAKHSTNLSTLSGEMFVLLA